MDMKLAPENNEFLDVKTIIRTMHAAVSSAARCGAHLTKCNNPAGRFHTLFCPPPASRRTHTRTQHRAIWSPRILHKTYIFTSALHPPPPPPLPLPSSLVPSPSLASPDPVLEDACLTPLALSRGGLRQLRNMGAEAAVPLKEGGPLQNENQVLKCCNMNKYQ